MHCKVCGHEGLIEAEYRTGEFTAPALECSKCQAIHLDERAAKSEKDLDSVRRAVVARHSASGPDDSGTHRTHPGTIPADQVDAVVSEVDVVLAEVRLALDVLRQVSSGEAAKAVADALGGIHRITMLIDDLGRRCEKATRRRTTDDGSGRASG
jgi:hypothetical protein